MKYSFLFVLICCFASCLMSQSEYGKASYYADKFQGNKTANGERFDQKKLTAAHRTLPFNTYVKVTNTSNQKSVIVKINDRGPFVKGVVVDLSKAAAKRLDMIQSGVVNVKLEIVSGPAEKSTLSIQQNTSKNNTVAVEQPKTVTPPKQPVNTISLSSSKPRIGKSTNLFSVTVKELALENYGIQVGSYAQYQNILKAINTTQQKTEQPCMVFVGKSSDGNALYKLILGPFPSKSTAERYLAALKKERINGFVVDLKNIK